MFFKILFDDLISFIFFFFFDKEIVLYVFLAQKQKICDYFYISASEAS